MEAVLWRLRFSWCFVALFFPLQSLIWFPFCDSGNLYKYMCILYSYPIATIIFMHQVPRPASGSPLHCWQPSIFSCWPAAVELPATGGYFGTVFGDLPRSTQRRFCLLSHFLTFDSSDIYSSGPCSVLNT